MAMTIFHGIGTSILKRLDTGDLRPRASGVSHIKVRPPSSTLLAFDEVAAAGRWMMVIIRWPLMRSAGSHAAPGSAFAGVTVRWKSMVRPWNSAFNSPARWEAG